MHVVGGGAPATVATLHEAVFGCVGIEALVVLTQASYTEQRCHQLQVRSLHSGNL